jgi:sugar/nucleoside kinase (ribokinase family)
MVVIIKEKIILLVDVPVKDVSGAGDTFLAGLVVEYMLSQKI